MRKWIDLFLFYATVIIIFSGIVLYIMPHGRVAYFIGWKFLGLNKDNWDNLHIIFGLVMTVVAIWHIVVNWKVLKRYLFQKESVFAFSLIGVISVGTVLDIQPFKSVNDLQNYIKNSWEVTKAEIPIAHGELLSLREFCSKLKIPLDRATERLKAKGIKFNVNKTLKKIGEENNLSPYKIYLIIKPEGKAKEKAFVEGSGIGIMSLLQFCKKYNCNVDKAIKVLKTRGIIAEKNQTLKEVASSNNTSPINIVKIIKGNK